ncbi:U32 family peptidase [Petrotoga sp. 9PWA.NaAc.5.4]|uniref:peptidase U32 family protein n=1 Tax=Petrotoga sp. 9PWA.NaAc.5.4 TaxID=1434328 RepID=UPI000CABEC4F|nr:U32 family peptidase [Petrotoga sp. 9PWA.NaAc.5.4]PNR95344.1 protease [Petrotoga sp. 9PWA.NaAc.5.4]
MKKVELLSPAGNYEKLETVYHYGADAAYIGGKFLNLRAFSKNFEDDELEKAVELAHKLNKKLFITVNAIPHNGDLEILPEYIKYLESIKVDAIIVADLGVFNIVRKLSNLPITISTQANNTNWASVSMWKDLGAKRIILARELSLSEIAEIRQKVPDVELEVFIHGAMCISVSGRCLLSNYLTGRDANTGECTQPCRWKYYIMEEKRPGEYFPIFEDEKGTYIMNSKDLCTVDFLNKIIETGVDSLKIEGRMKSSYYAGVTTKIYREAIDSYYSGNFKKENIEKWIKELQSVSHREYTSGFYLNKPDTDSQNYKTSSYIRNYKFVGKVIEKISESQYIVDVRNKIKKGEEIEIVSKIGNNIAIHLNKIVDYETKESLEEANPNQKIIIDSEKNIEVGDLIRVLL